MQWKLFFYSILIGTPSVVMAQGPKVSYNTDGKKIAMNTNSDQRTGKDSSAQKGLPFVMNSSSKTIEVSAQESKKIKGENQSAKLAMASSMERPADHFAEPNDKFKAVPLAGETDYFGNMNAYVVNYVKNYMTNFSGRLYTVKGRGNSVFEVMNQVLASHSLPKELKYLAVIESALNKNARSPVGAVGYWQFMESTGKLMGLTVNKHRDDRTDLVKSTHAAAKYLSYLYDQLDDWLLVIAAYNSGPRPVINAMQRTGKDDFWSIKAYLPKETQNHVLAFIATATIMERLDHFLLPGIPSNFDWSTLNVANSAAARAKKPSNPLLTKFTESEIKQMAIVRIKTPLDLEVVSNTLNIDRRQLGKWNYDYFEYLETYKTGKLYNFRIPKDKLDVFLEKLSQLERASKNMQM